MTDTPLEPLAAPQEALADIEPPRRWSLRGFLSWLAKTVVGLALASDEKKRRSVQRRGVSRSASASCGAAKGSSGVSVT